MNIAVSEALKIDNFDCFVFHDVGKDFFSKNCINYNENNNLKNSFFLLRSNTRKLYEYI